MRNFAETALFRLVVERERERDRDEAKWTNKERKVENQIKNVSDVYKLPFKNVSVRSILTHET